MKKFAAVLLSALMLISMMTEPLYALGNLFGIGTISGTLLGSVPPPHCKN